ncbi:MAG: THUMP domain-containing protein [Nanoarchaeota archaeon]|nr:THUMP domain-containing protein [Nanoarchaeota archaeon]
MTYDTILLRYGEIFLKGKNRGTFEQKLVENIREIVSREAKSVPKVKKSQGRLLMPYFSDHRVLQRIFGLTSYSPAVRVEKITEEIQHKAVELLQEKKGTFKVATKRSDKSFPITSPEFNRSVGGYIEDKTALRFSLTDPDIVLEIEINQEGAYLFFESITCAGGLPAGVEGKVLLLVEDEAGLLAGLLFLKRGCSVFPVAFAEMDISLLQAFSPVELKLHQVKNVQELEELATQKEISILVTGQTFGDKAKGKTNLTVMKPLIAYSKKQIEEQLNRYKNLASIPHQP